MNPAYHCTLLAGWLAHDHNGVGRGEVGEYLALFDVGEGLGERVVEDVGYARGGCGEGGCGFVDEQDCAGWGDCFLECLRVVVVVVVVVVVAGGGGLDVVGWFGFWFAEGFWVVGRGLVAWLIGMGAYGIVTIFWTHCCPT